MKKLILIAIGLMCFGCQPYARNKPYRTLDGFAQGTTYHIVYLDPQGRDLKKSIDSLLHRFDLSLSLYDEHSLLTKINNNTTDRVDSLFSECFSISKDVYEKTGGIFDVTGNPLFQIWGFGKGERKKHISQHTLDSILNYVGMNKVQIHSGRIIKQDPHITLNFNAVAQGYSSDVVARYLENLGIGHYLVEIGGEIFCKGKNPKHQDWVVGIDKPYENNDTPGESIQEYIQLSGKGLATSGNYRKFFVENGKKYVHSINPLTGKTAQNSLLSATVVAPTAAIADAVATAYMVLGMEHVDELQKKFPDCEIFLIYDVDGKFKEYWSEGMKKMIRKK